MKGLLKAFAAGALISAAINWVLPVGEARAISPKGDETDLWAIFLVGLLMLIPCIAIVISAILWISSKRRAHLAQVILASIGYLAMGAGMGRFSQDIRMDGFRRLAERSEPLVMAIEKFEAEKGRPPACLADLVPDYITSVPSTGMGAYPEYGYSAGAENRLRHFNNDWMLFINTPPMGLGFDMFIYYPNQNYPDRAFGGRLELIGKWAYVHE